MLVVVTYHAGIEVTVCTEFIHHILFFDLILTPVL